MIFHIKTFNRLRIRQSLEGTVQVYVPVQSFYFMSTGPVLIQPNGIIIILRINSKNLICYFDPRFVLQTDDLRWPLYCQQSSWGL